MPASRECFDAISDSQRPRKGMLLRTGMPFHWQGTPMVARGSGQPRSPGRHGCAMKRRWPACVQISLPRASRRQRWIRSSSDSGARSCRISRGKGSGLIDRDLSGWCEKQATPPEWSNSSKGTCWGERHCLAPDRVAGSDFRRIGWYCFASPLRPLNRSKESTCRFTRYIGTIDNAPVSDLSRRRHCRRAADGTSSRYASSSPAVMKS